MHVASCQLIHSEWKHDRNRFLMTASARKLKFCVETPKDLCGTIMHTWWPRFRFICFVTLNTPCALFAPERCRFYHRYFWLAVTTVIRNTSTLGTMVPFITQTIMLLNPPKKTSFDYFPTARMWLKQNTIFNSAITTTQEWTKVIYTTQFGDDWDKWWCFDL